MTETIDQPISQLNEHVAQLFRQGRYQAALPLAQQACELARGQAGNDALALGESLNHLANLHRELGNYTQAEQPYLEALKIKRAALGRDHPDFARSLNDLARFYEVLGNYKQAEPLFQQALAIRRKALGNDHPDCAQTLNDLAALYESTSRLDEAETHCRAALRLKPDLADARSNLQAVLRRKGQPATAESLPDFVCHLAETQMKSVELP